MDKIREVAVVVGSLRKGSLNRQLANSLAELAPATLELEGKLSCLTRWILDAHAQGIACGLKLPGKLIGLGRGESHRDRCLEALALL